MTDLKADAGSTMEAAATTAAKLGMVEAADWAALRDRQQVLIASPTGFIELGEVEADTRYIQSGCWVIYRVHGSGLPIYEVQSPASSDEPDRTTESRSLLPEGSVLYIKQDG